VVSDGTADEETAGSGIDLEAGGVVVELDVEAEGTDVRAIPHQANEGHGGGVGVGDEAAGFVRLLCLLLEAVEVHLEVFEVVGIVSGLRGEIGFEFCDALGAGEARGPDLGFVARAFCTRSSACWTCCCFRRVLTRPTVAGTSLGLFRRVS
jgi:hypothetical protein